MTLVREFHEAMGIPILDRPSIPDIKRVELRRRLLQEEFKEADEEFARIIARHAHYASAEDVHQDVSRLAKELSDIRYVCWGADLEFGIPSDTVDAEVHRSNMTKVWPDGKPRHRHDGKVLKPPTYSEANILRICGYIESTGELIP